MKVSMRNVIQFDGIKFWVDKNIIHCKLYTGFFKNYQKINIEDILFNSISILSNGNYMPILINLEQISNSNSLKFFKLISNSDLMKTLVLSRVYLVQSAGLKVLLSLHKNNSNQFISNKIYKDFNLAIESCYKDYMVYNKLSK